MVCRGVEEFDSSLRKELEGEVNRLLPFPRDYSIQSHASSSFDLGDNGSVVSVGFDD